MLMIATIPAAFGRLCVETGEYPDFVPTDGPAAFGRLCVETIDECFASMDGIASRLRAAVC